MYLPVIQLLLSLQSQSGESSELDDGSQHLRDVLLLVWGQMIMLFFASLPDPHRKPDLKEHTLIWVRSLPIRYDRKYSLPKHAFFCELVIKYPDLIFNMNPVDNSLVMHIMLQIYSSEFSDTVVDEKLVFILRELKKSDRWLPAISHLQKNLASEAEASKLQSLESLL